MLFPVHRRSLHPPSQPVSLLLLIGSLALAWLAAQWVLEETFHGLLYPLGYCVGALLIVLSLVQWRLGLLLVLAWLVFEDLPRKYLGNNMQVYLVKYLLCLGVYAGFLVARMRRQERPWRPPFLLALGCLFLLAVVQMFNPSSPGLLYGLLGLTLYFFFAPLVFLGYSLPRQPGDVDRLFRLLLVLGGLTGLVGIVQAAGWKNFLNPAALAPELTPLGHLIRYAPGTRVLLFAPPSVFVSQGRYQNFLGLIFTLTLGVLAMQLLRHQRSWTTYLVLGVLGAAIYLGGSKGTMLYALMTLGGIGVALLWGTREQPWLTSRIAKILRRSLLALAAGIIVLSSAFPSLTRHWGQYYYEMLWPESPHSILQERVARYPWNEFQKVFEIKDWYWGYGTGIASLGTQYISKLYDSPTKTVGWVENGYGCLILEMGILGPLLWLICAVSILFHSWRLTRRLASSPYHPLAFSIFWYSAWLLFPFTWGGLNTYQNFVVNAYFWVLVGVLFRLPELVQSAEQPPSRPASAAREPWRYAAHPV